MRQLYLCGAGNSEAIRLALTINRSQPRWDRIVILDDDPQKHGTSILGLEIAGPFEALEKADAGSTEVANLVGRTTVKRWSAWRKIAKHGLPFTSMIDPNVNIEGAELADDVIVYQNAMVGPLVSIGEASAVFMGAIVGHGSRMGRCCVVAPNAVINARVQVGDGVYVGTNAAILPDVKLGPWATIAAGTVVMQDVPAGATVMGVPGKIILTLEQKLKMCPSDVLPQELLPEYRERVSKAYA